MSEALGKQVAGSHYKSMAIQPAEFCQRNRLPYLESCVVRYITRHGRKNGRQDIEKAIHCLEMLLDLEYPANPIADGFNPVNVTG
jgi:hypothetical protein